MLNFMKGSLFSRDTGNQPEGPAVEKDTQVLAVWGSPDRGNNRQRPSWKHLADKKRNVALLLCDMTAPMLPCVCPPSDLECEKSLGSILAAAHVTDTLVKQNCVTHKRYRHLLLIGMLKGENVFT